MKMLSHSNLTGIVFYGTVNTEKQMYVGKKDIVDDEQFIRTMINYIRHRETNSDDGAIVEIQGRKFNLKALEIK